MLRRRRRHHSLSEDLKGKHNWGMFAATQDHPYVSTYTISCRSICCYLEQYMVCLSDSTFQWVAIADFQLRTVIHNRAMYLRNSNRSLQFRNSSSGNMSYQLLHILGSYSLRPEILVIEIDVSRCILVLDTFIFIHFDDKYFWTEGVVLRILAAQQQNKGHRSGISAGQAPATSLNLVQVVTEFFFLPVRL